MNSFANRVNPTLLKFVIANVNPFKKNITVFNNSIRYAGILDLMKVPGLSENEIRDSLIKGDLHSKIVNGDIKVLSSNIDLVTFDETFKNFLNNNGIVDGTVIPNFLLENPPLSTADATGSVGTYTCDASVTVGNVVYLSGANMVARADADDVLSQPVIGIVSSKSSITQALVKYNGEMDIFTGLVPGSTYFLSLAPGEFTTIAPSSQGSIVQKIGFAKNTTTLVVLIDRDYVVI